MGLLAVKEFEEPSTKLGFDGFDNMATDGGPPEGPKGTNQPPPEKVDEDGKGESAWNFSSLGGEGFPFQMSLLLILHYPRRSEMQYRFISQTGGLLASS